jgi:uncharacterized membrane protein YdbT with pleckstrin-like domain
MVVSPSATNKFFKVGASVDVLVVRREIVQEFGRSVDTSWCKADAGMLAMVVMVMAVMMVTSSMTLWYISQDIPSRRIDPVEGP